MFETMSKRFGFHFSPGHHNVPHSQEQVQVISAMDALTFVNFWILAEDATTDLLPPRPIQKLWVSKKFKYLLETHNWYVFVETFGRNLAPNSSWLFPKHVQCTQKNIVFYHISHPKNVPLKGKKKHLFMKKVVRYAKVITHHSSYRTKTPPPSSSF